MRGRCTLVLASAPVGGDSTPPICGAGRVASFGPASLRASCSSFLRESIGRHPPIPFIACTFVINASPPRRSRCAQEPGNAGWTTGIGVPRDPGANPGPPLGGGASSAPVNVQSLLVTGSCAQRRRRIASNIESTMSNESDDGALILVGLSGKLYLVERAIVESSLTWGGACFPMLSAILRPNCTGHPSSSEASSSVAVGCGARPWVRWCRRSARSCRPRSESTSAAA